MRVMLTLAASLLATAAAAQEPPMVLARDATTRPLESRPTPRAVASFRDVLRVAWPDLGTDGRAAEFAGALAAPDAGEDSPPGAAEIDISRGSMPTFLTVSEGERDHVAMLLGDVLVVAQVAPEFHPAGALMVRTDPGGAPSLTQMLMLGEGRPGVLVLNSHHNSQESFEQYLLAAPLQGALRQVFQTPILYSVQTYERGCEPRRLEQRLLPLTTRPPERDGYAEVALTVRVGRICVQRNRPRTVSTQFHYARLRWDAQQARYLGGMVALERQNRRLMGLE
ncbi:hypothetical protein [Roseococcus sp. YIM B11640]|uniref:hypothetical protein n=1 Tax=Roseococcus sp. YIM B11640 TaxID=3133973 RepID=UPI003C7A5D6C